MNYIDDNFDISAIECFNNLNGMLSISDYLDFATYNTIVKQYPNLDFESEKILAKELLGRYINGDKYAFTSKYNIRNNMSNISHEKLKFLMLKTLIEQDAYRQRIEHRIQPKNNKENFAKYVTDSSINGVLDQIDIESNIDFLIDNYVENRYRYTSETKKQYEDIAYSVPSTDKALEKLNLELKLQEIKQK